MRRLVSRLLILLAAVQILGGHWAVLQTVAWTSMLIENVQTESLPEALTKTFDGTRPCSLCKVVTAGRNSEEEKGVTRLLVKIEAILAPAIHLPACAVASHDFADVARFERVLAFSPPTPPPRFA